jgi:hypothetical protein
VLGVQRFPTEGLALSSDLLRRGTQPDGPEILTGVAVANVELVADDRKPHRVGAEQEAPVFDCVKADIRGDSGRAPAIPARAVSRFRLDVHYFVCCGT